MGWAVFRELGTEVLTKVNSSSEERSILRAESLAVVDCQPGSSYLENL